MVAFQLGPFTIAYYGIMITSGVIDAIERLKGYADYNVICSVTNQNMKSLNDIVDFFHDHEVPVYMLNPVRCTWQGAWDIKPTDVDLAWYYLSGLGRTYKLYEKTGRKLVAANFANVRVDIVAPTVSGPMSRSCQIMSSVCNRDYRKCCRQPVTLKRYVIKRKSIIEDHRLFPSEIETAALY